MGTAHEELRVRSLGKITKDLVCECDPEGRYTYVSPAHAGILGYEPGDLVGKSAWDLIHPDDRDRLRNAARQGQLTTHGFVYRGRHKDGSWRWLEGRGTRFRGEDERWCLLGVARDLTEQKLAENALRESEARYRALAELAGELVSEYDAEGRFVYANPSFRSVLGYEPDELLGCSLSDLYHPDERAGMVTGFAQMLTLGIEGPRRVFRLRHRDGSWHWFEGMGTLVRTPLGDAHLVATARDITERREMRERLRRSEANLAEAQQLAHIGSGELDVSSGVAHWSDEQYRILGLEPGEIEPTVENFMGFVHPDDRESFSGAWRVKLEERREFPDARQYRIVRKDGQERILQGRGRLKLDRTGTPDRFAWSLEDITERRQLEHERQTLEAQVRDMQKLESLGLLAGGIAHDFNNLLVGILGSADLMRAELPAGSPAAANLTEMERAAERAADLVRHLLDYAGQRSPDMAPTDLSDVLGESRPLIEASLPSTLSLDWHLPGSLPPVRADRVQLQQVLINLVSNAATAIGGAAGYISIRSGMMLCDRAALSAAALGAEIEPGPYVFLEVRDTGAGMDEQTRARIFDPFFTTRSEGRGLGLSTVLGIVRAHGGAIQVASLKGQGSTVRVLLPRTEHPPTRQAEEEPTAPPAERSGTTTVLLIDDDELVRNVTGRMLEQAGFKSLLAADAPEGIELLRKSEQSIDCILLDVTMPRMTVSEAVDGLRKIRDDVPVLLCSGYSEADVFETISRHGASGFIAKPYRLTELVSQIEAATRSAP